LNQYTESFTQPLLFWASSALFAVDHETSFISTCGNNCYTACSIRNDKGTEIANFQIAEPERQTQPDRFESVAIVFLPQHFYENSRPTLHTMDLAN
jgi:hypothetical protein